MDDRIAAYQTSYDRVADAYAEQFFHELDQKPLDRGLLDAFAELVGGQGLVADVGCGPGQIGRYLLARGLPVVGVDLSPGMVALAGRLTPEIPFQVGNMLALPAADGAWAGIVAFYAIVHLAPDVLPRACGEFQRVLRPGGYVLLSFHVGEEVVHRDDLWGAPVDLDFQFHTSDAVAAALEAAGFAVAARLERRPYEPVEHPSRRGYILARKPEAPAGA